MLQRLFCLGSSHNVSDGEWVVARTQHHQTQALYTASKILDIVEAEVDERFKSTKGSKRSALEPNSMRRLHRANLPMEDSQRATEVISKLTAIDNSKLRFQKEYARMEQELAEAKEEKRLAEFAQARAEQLAIARGEALYKCQERLTEAERQQVQLADVLKLTLDKLGMGLTPSPLPSQEYERSPGQLPDRPAGPLFASANGLAVDASSPQDTTELAVVENQQHSSSGPDTPLSGFTVYSNELHDSPEAGGRDSRAHPTYYTSLDNEQQQRRQYLESLRPKSATKWKDISEVVHRSSSPDCATPLGTAPTNNNNAALAIASNGLDPDAEADRLAQLIIPHLQASQLESLVRFGASLGSPALASPTMQRHLIDALRKSRTEEIGKYQDRMQQQQNQLIADSPSMMPLAPPPQQQQQLLPPARPPMQQPFAGGGPLSQAAGWTSPGLNGSSAHHIKTVFGNATTTAVNNAGSGNSGGDNGFYKPFSAAATTSIEETAAEGQDAIDMPAPPLPKKTMFKINGSAAAAPPPKYQQQQQQVDPHNASSETIKAVIQSHDGVPEDDRFARQRRAAERLAAKINSKLPPEFRTADPLGLGTKAASRDVSATDVVRSRPASCATTSSGGSGSGGKRAPKGSLRRRQEEAYRWGE